VIKQKYDDDLVTVDRPGHEPAPAYIKLCHVLPIVASIDYDVSILGLKGKFSCDYYLTLYRMECPRMSL
jgi:hypothetical protein